MTMVRSVSFIATIPASERCSELTLLQLPHQSESGYYVAVIARG
jgi:hypothetical protein